ncbi:putative Microfibrillar-associated protein 1 [Monocercomonoides exilis]|uniref:putative Microfibrillar-associated protein 1 n=1 Tax=Monocercomonoides exilis TaxID=2049356 RepID=UPI0035594FAB|nr:putative Microfibrillar-associated protein 1 [Monocercomonoides exilis]|eukprot:MONOS_1689.1-p1 / transcript=MONOS_1689.1 / gene=MONOS_1689 / organism=Monocercomonoides_exilis_PA203 / gene_product=Microfibrillar-associated protein 1 / transcript_product=Microfibrillar-associated protein 1 / location=Mono_scaffold00031:100544-101544(+) / protein_length=239 / sequence_SO=supercontig / SO=protein_coding / is_pseudo=false
MLIYINNIFFFRGQRATLSQQAEIISAKEEDNDEEAYRLAELEKEKKAEVIYANILSEKAAEEEAKKAVDDGSNLIDDTDKDDDEVEYEMWRQRELSRIQRTIQEREDFFKQQEELTHRDQMTEEERNAIEELHLKEAAEKQPKRKWKFLQKYYHKGAFFQGEDEIYERDYSKPTGEDRFDKENLPGVMQKKRWGLKSNTKYTHLVAEDTTRFDDNLFLEGQLQKTKRGRENPKEERRK